MSTRFYENNIDFRCKSCDNKLEGVVYKDQHNISTTVLVEPCQRCLQCAEAEIEELKREATKQINELQVRIAGQHGTIVELQKRIDNMYVHYEGRRAKTIGDWEKWDRNLF